MMPAARCWLATSFGLKQPPNLQKLRQCNSLHCVFSDMQSTTEVMLPVLIWFRFPEMMYLSAIGKADHLKIERPLQGSQFLLSAFAMLIQVEVGSASYGPPLMKVDWVRTGYKLLATA